MRIVPMERERAEQIARWTYGGPYAIYDFENTPETLAELLNGDYYAAMKEHDGLVGYFCYGGSARIPTTEPDIYDDAALDIGLGLRPDLCGQGLGPAFVQAGLSFARGHFGVERFRLTVAAFNARAVRAYEKAGFRVTGTVTHLKTNLAFIIMETNRIKPD